MQELPLFVEFVSLRLRDWHEAIVDGMYVTVVVIAVALPYPALHVHSPVSVSY